ncbi:MAG: hypothetical protein ACOCV4_06725 [Myxococcota bacterium]
MSSIRSMLAEEGSWPAIREAFAQRYPHDSGWLDERMWSTWIDLDRHVALLDAAAEVMGLDGVRHIGRRRLTEELRAGLFARIVRSWLRSFAEHPSYLLRVAPYLWRAGFRDCGDMLLQKADARSLDYCLQGAPPHLLQSDAWRALLEGFAQGMFELARVEGDIAFDSPEGEPEVVYITCRW